MIAGEGFRLVIGVGDYEFPDATDDGDANWLTGEARLALTAPSGARFDASCAVFWTTRELHDFHRELGDLLKTGSGQAELATLEDQVALRVDLRRGRGTLAGHVQEHAVATVEFDDVPTDQSYLADALGRLGRIVERFPVRR